MGRPESLTFGWLCRAARPRVHGGVGAPSPSAPHSPHCLGLCPLLFRVRHTSQGSHHPGKGFCDLHPSPWVCQGSTPEGEGCALVPVAGAADRVRGLGRRAKAPCSHRRRPLGSSQLNRICHSLCRPPAGSLPGPPLVWGAPTGGPGCWAQAEALPLPLPQGSRTHSCARM